MKEFLNKFGLYQRRGKYSFLWDNRKTFYPYVHLSDYQRWRVALSKLHTYNGEGLRNLVLVLEPQQRKVKI